MHGQYPGKNEWASWIQKEIEEQAGNQKLKNNENNQHTSSSGCCSGTRCC